MNAQKPFEFTPEIAPLIVKLSELLSYEDVMIAMDRAQTESDSGRCSVAESLQRTIEEKEAA